MIRSADIERVANFYQQIGLSFTRHSHGSGPEHYVSENDGLVFEIYPITPKSGPTVGTRIGFCVVSVDESVKALSEVGAKLVVSPATSEWGRCAVLKDLDGHSVELVTPKQPTN